MKLKCWRHGEILFIEAKDIPKEAKEKKTDILAIGKSGSSHSFKGGKFYEFKGNIFGYLKADGTKLFHPEHSPKGEAKLPDGIYELRKGQEFTPDGLKPIID